jgi:hypothetical protein
MLVPEIPSLPRVLKPKGVQQRETRRHNSDRLRTTSLLSAFQHTPVTLAPLCFLFDSGLTLKYYLPGCFHACIRSLDSRSLSKPVSSRTPFEQEKLMLFQWVDFAFCMLILTLRYRRLFAAFASGTVLAQGKGGNFSGEANEHENQPTNRKKSIDNLDRHLSAVPFDKRNDPGL